MIQIVLIFFALQTYADNQYGIKFITRNKAELEAKGVLEKLLSQFDLKKFIYTKEVQIQEGALPVSAPLLTLNSVEGDNPDVLLGSFIHENMHLFLDQDARGEKIAAEFKKHYPDAPAKLMEGGYDAESTYDHIAVCWLEYKGLSKFIGEPRAKKTVLSRKYYTWIYKKAVEDSEYIETVVKKYSGDEPLR